jgi:hypothetical protein
MSGSQLPAKNELWLRVQTPPKSLNRRLPSVFTVKRIGLHEAIEQFIAFRKGKTADSAGECRRQLTF